MRACLARLWCLNQCDKERILVESSRAFVADILALPGHHKAAAIMVAKLRMRNHEERLLGLRNCFILGPPRPFNAIQGWFAFDLTLCFSSRRFFAFNSPTSLISCEFSSLR